MTKLLLSGLMIAVSFACKAQSLEKMQWFNEPEQWEEQFSSDECHTTNRLLAHIPLWIHGR